MKLNKFLKSIGYDPEDGWDPELRVQCVSEAEMFHPSSRGYSAELVQAWQEEKGIVVQIVIKENENIKTLHV